jgi:hypothetical protein
VSLDGVGEGSVWVGKAEVEQLMVNRVGRPGGERESTVESVKDEITSCEGEGGGTRIRSMLVRRSRGRGGRGRKRSY